MIGWRQRAKARLQQSWYGRDPTLVAVPLTLAAIELLAQQAQLRSLLFPPLPEHEALIDERFSGLSVEERAQLADLLSKLARSQP